MQYVKDIDILNRINKNVTNKPLIMTKVVIDIDTAIRKFAQFVNVSWLDVLPLLKDRSYTNDESSVHDWLQANWELLVERKVLRINQHLDIYGEGADFNGSSSRITDSDALPDFSIIVNGRVDDEVVDLLSDEKKLIRNCDFIELISFKNEFYEKRPPFDHVLLEDHNGEEIVASIKDVKFELIQINQKLFDFR